MPYRFKCEHCNSTLESMIMRIGKQIKCKNCDKRATIPNDAEYFERDELDKERAIENQKKQDEKKQDEIEFLTNYEAKSRQIIENSNLIGKLGTIKRIKLYEEGFTVKGLRKDYYHGWNQIERIKFSWLETVTNVFAHDHDFTLHIEFKSALKIEPKYESFSPKSLYINLSERFIKKFIASLSVLSEIHSFTFRKS